MKEGKRAREREGKRARGQEGKRARGHYLKGGEKFHTERTVERGQNFLLVCGVAHLVVIQYEVLPHRFKNTVLVTFELHHTDSPTVPPT